MAKTQKLSTKWNVKSGTLNIEVSAWDLDENGKYDKDAKAAETFTRALDLATVFPGYAALSELGQTALEFGVFTVLRNTTGSASDLTEAAAAMDRRIEAFDAGEWGAEREQSATPFLPSHIFARAIEKATGGRQTAAEAAEKLCAAAEATCAANSLPAFSEIDPSERGKIRKAVVDAIKASKPLIAAALAALEAERDEAALARKREAAAKALAAAAGSEEAGI